MHLTQIVAAEELGGRAMRAIRPFIERGPDRDALERAQLILAEVRHFAVCWDDIRAADDAKTIDADQAKQRRQACIRRLTSFVAPDRL